MESLNFMGFIGAILFFVILLYVIYSVGIMKLIQAEGGYDTYKAWIPVYNNYVLGEIIEKEIPDSDMVKADLTKYIFTFSFMLSVIPTKVGDVLVIICAIYQLIVLAIFANKYGTAMSMIITNVFLVPGIGLMILAKKMAAAKAENEKKRIEDISAVSARDNEIKESEGIQKNKEECPNDESIKFDTKDE